MDSPKCVSCDAMTIDCIAALVRAVQSMLSVNPSRKFTGTLRVVAVPRSHFSPSGFIASELQRYNIDDLYDSTLLEPVMYTRYQG